MAIMAPRALPPIAPSGAAAHRTQNTTGRQAIWDPAGFASLSMFLSPLPSCKAVLKKSALFWWCVCFCGVINASLRRSFCCVAHQKRDFKAHPAASQHDSPRLLLSTRRRLSALDSQLPHPLPRLALGSRNSRSGFRLCGQRGLEFDCGLRKGLFDGRNHTLRRL